MRTYPNLIGGAVLLMFYAQAARADDANFRPYIVGSRAAGMGGAFTALADDGSGPYYNPGGLAFVRRSQVALSASVYGVVSGTNTDALGDGHDFTFRDLNIFPVSTSVVWKLGEGDKPEGDGTALAISVFVPDAFRTNDRDTIGASANAVFADQEQQTVWTGLTWSRRWGRFGFGASGYFLFGTALSQFELTAISPASASEFATITARNDETTYGFVGSLGARWDVTEAVSLGVSAFSPEWGWGKRRSFSRVAVGDNVSAPGAPATVVVVNAEDLTATPSLPARIQAGIAWVGDRIVLAADAIFLAGREVHDDQDRASEGLDRIIKHNPVLNASVGLEYRASDALRLRAGFFTDFAASDEPVRTTPGVTVANNTVHVNRYGGTLSAGFHTEHTSTDAGINLSYGSGTDLVPNNLDFTDLKPTTATQLLFYVFLASAYEF